MKRRRFLQSSGLAGVVPLATAQVPAGQKPVLITSAASRLAQTLAAGLKDRYPMRLTERVAVKTEHDFVECTLGHDATTNTVVRGVGAIVHVAEPLPGDTAEQQVDLLTRCTYNLLTAAAEEKAPLAVMLSTLDVVAGYDANLTVSETWQPRPSAEPRVLSKHLGEITCREFARDAKVNIAVLRLGTVVRAEDVKGKPFDPLWVDERDVVHAVSLALTAKLGPWQIFHIQSDSPKARFAVTRAKAALKYEPQYRW
jgi:nucleoside-diphosphate-sugar epimerase